MPRYYAFLVKNNIRKLYIDKEVDLYILLKKLYKTNDNNIVLRISVYNQLFELFDVKKIMNYLDKKINIKKNKNKYLFNISECYEKTLIEINHSSFVIITNIYNPSIFKSLKYIYNDIFICDFNNNRYMFLNNN